MIEIPIYNTSGDQTGTYTIDPSLLGGEVRPALLKQAFVRFHANRRSVNATTKSRSMVNGSGKKLYKQKGTGNARRGDKKANILRGGGNAHAKVGHSWRQGMPTKMRRLANRNALLAKAVDGEIKLIDDAGKFEKPSTKQFASLLSALKIDRTCLVALADVTSAEAKSAKNLDNIDTTQIDRLNAFDLLNHRYLVAHKDAFEAYVTKVTQGVKAHTVEAA
ncbi:50S ribosomal protein L4 [Algisphaera agarilytica]|uniref:Large ribosomal subunit protein uL4 n=1 Tax=Algisphaera agarilytica TaxID=1385975 RepID=A0A7X0LLH9_9BACT|nr:50S ribosomal protein L4 [Algisphaera agarilytica]MBB6431027.1 large subunit ribosomal protein L4 [Algisphaera agarilytica]